MKYLTKIIFFLTLFLGILANAFTTSAQTDKGFLYGTITTIDETTYEGVIRWGKEEVFWTDFFNSVKESNPYYKYLSDEDREPRRRRGWRKVWRDNWVEISSNSYSSRDGGRHKFACRFGEIRSIQMEGRSSVTLEVKGGKYINLRGGSNDIETKVWIMDDEIGMMKLSWDRIRKVEFKETPSPLENKFGEPLYGVVETRQGKFEGFIQWDHDERITTDKLDGESKDGDVSLAFGKLVSIEREGFGCNVKLKSGRELYLDDSNDVDSGNRGVIVTIPDVGRVDIRWRDFIRVEFQKVPNGKIMSYSDFPEGERISGSVHTVGGETYSGILVYDLDEAIDIEMLDGYNDNLEYSIPLRNIKSVTPKNYNYYLVELKNGDQLLLGEQRDVSEGNDGVLVFSNKEHPTYLNWKKIQKIVFD
jgi:hypothetical protein